MALKAVSAQTIAAPTIEIIPTQEPGYFPEKVYLRAIDPTSTEQSQALMLLLENTRKGDEVLVELFTNNLSFRWVLAAIRKQFDRTHSVVESWVPEANMPF